MLLSLPTLNLFLTKLEKSAASYTQAFLMSNESCLEARHVRRRPSQPALANVTMSDTDVDHLSKLPTELLVSIFQQCTDFSSLWSLIHTSSRLLSVFDEWACDIANAVLNTKVPSPTRAPMQGVLSLHKGTFLCRTPENELSEFDWAEVPLFENLSGALSQIKWLIRLAHHINIFSRLNIEQCLKRCLQGPLGQREYPPGFETPSWTEEQRSLLGFWRAIFLNQLRKASLGGSLRWPTHTIEYLHSSSQFAFDPLTPVMQINMALDYFTDVHLL